MSNFIQVTDNLAIQSSTFDWSIVKRTKRKDRKTKESIWAWEPLPSYHGTLRGAVKAMGEHLLRTSDANTYTELVQAANDISLLLGQHFTASADVSIKPTTGKK